MPSGLRRATGTRAQGRRPSRSSLYGSRDATMPDLSLSCASSIRAANRHTHGGRPWLVGVGWGLIRACRQRSPKARKASIRSGGPGGWRTDHLRRSIATTVYKGQRVRRHPWGRLRTRDAIQPSRRGFPLQRTSPPRTERLPVVRTLPVARATRRAGQRAVRGPEPAMSAPGSCR